MNLSEALDAALPELPRSRLLDNLPPRLDPDLIVREDLLDGMPSISILQRASAQFARLTPGQWQLAQLFDGSRSYEEIARTSEELHGSVISAADVREFAEGIEECGFLYKSPQDKNLAMREKLAVQRARRTRGKFSIAHVSFSAWDPDGYLTALDRSIGKYIYSRWFTLFAVILFLFEAGTFAAKWGVIGHDVPLYYDFSRKSFSDLLEFWLLFFVLGFLHESAHGLTCKHFGGEVHSMGFLFLYLTPAFYCDVTEVWISATRIQRLATIIAGIWIELVLCGIATVIWTETLPGQWSHDFCYKIILLTGIAVPVINLNPLIKLDGYYFLTEWIRVPDLKERSTGFFQAWVQRYIFRLPVDMPIVSRKRVPLLVGYAIASGLYSYLLLYAFIRFSYNVFSHWFAELAILPALGLAFLIFRSRLRSLRKFTIEWLSSRKALRGGILRPTPRQILFALLFLSLLLVPIWRERESAYFVIEPVQTAAVHAGLPGKIAAVYVREGQSVSAGQMLARLQSLQEASSAGSANTQLALSRYQLFDSEVRHSGVGDALEAERGAELKNSIAREQREQLNVTSPMAGTVVTSDPEDLLGSNVANGQTLFAVEDESHLVARIFLPGPEMAHINSADEVALLMPSGFREFRARLGPIEGTALTLPAGVVDSQQFKGIELPAFYASRIMLPDHADGFRAGMSGKAKVFGHRRSLASKILTIFGNFLNTHFW